MNKIINQTLFYTKIFLLLTAFSITLYILLIRMDTNNLSAWTIFPLFIPLLLVLIGFIFGLFFNIGRDNLLYNLVCVLVLLAIIVIDFRTIFDHNIISTTNINLDYFDINTSKIKIMLYLTVISNVLLVIYEKKIKIHS